MQLLTNTTVCNAKLMECRKLSPEVHSNKLEPHIEIQIQKSKARKQTKPSHHLQSLFFKTIYYNENGHCHPTECKQFI